MYAIHGDDEAEGADVDDKVPTAAPPAASKATFTSTAGQPLLPKKAGAHAFLRFMGSVKRQGGDRVVNLRFNEEGGLLACQGAGKTVELFRQVTEWLGQLLKLG